MNLGSAVAQFVDQMAAEKSCSPGYGDNRSPQLEHDFPSIDIVILAMDFSAHKRTGEVNRLRRITAT
jgi:hypothetical protein